MSFSLSTAGEGIFWFATVGATAASLKHFFSPEASLAELTPAAFPNPSTKQLHPASLWWGGYAFAIMNAGFASIGYHAAWTGSEEAKRGFLLGTAVLFLSFGASWFKYGPITGNKAHKKQGLKIFGLGSVFLLGFLIK
ncbi:UNVERIFIED_CONTAM: hypothetical protein HDU68_012673 [Siphonaria sp. JEL0065]|nr:hypothetical protein HDU68_012673 [Siphonaria sp. JEL0065]